MSRSTFCLLVTLWVVGPSAAHAGSISGTVVADLDSSPIEGARVRVANATNQDGGHAFTDATGAYTIDGLSPDAYIMTIEAADYVEERYDDISCLEGCPAGSGLPLVVGEDTALTGIDVRLTRFGELSGRVTDAQSGEPITDARVEARGVDGTFGFGSVPVAADGSYQIRQLAPGDYVLVVESGTHRGQMHENIACDGGIFFDCLPEDGTRVDVLLDAVTSIDFELDRLSTLTGRVTDEATSEPLAFIGVTAWSMSGGMPTTVTTDDAGEYAIPVPPGEYTLVTDSSGRYADELYDDRPCYFGNCDVSTGDRIVVGETATVSGLDFALGMGGAISGQVRAALGGRPLDQANVSVVDGDGEVVGFGRSDADGFYTINGLTTGTYAVSAQSGFTGFFETQLYDGIPCPGGCDYSLGTPVEVEIGSTTTGIDFDLQERGQITGTIRDASTGVGVPFPEIDIFLSDGVLWGTLQGNQDGSYRIGDLLDGEYFVVGRADGYLGILYPAIPCADAACDPTAGQPIRVGLDVVASGIDLDLPVAGGVSGTVRKASGEPVLAAEVTAYDDQGNRMESTLTDVDGNYRLIGLDTGVVYVVAAAGGFQAEAWDDTPCAIDCDPTSGTPIAVVLGRDTTGIDFSLARLGTIRGTVSNVDSGLPTEFAVVDVWTSSGALASSVLASAPNGSWVSEALLPGRYFVTTNVSGYRDQAWDGVDCEPTCDPTTGTPIDVVLDADVTGIDFALRRLRGITGTVTGTDSPIGVAGVAVGAWRVPDGAFETSTTTGPSGGYSMDLAPGVYTVGTANGQGAVDELWDDIACPDGSPLLGLCDPTDGIPITIQPETLVTDIDFALEGLQPGCRENDETLCLADGRFRVEANWRDKDGNFGVGRVRPITGDTGYVWFFGPDNVEVVIKVLDACVAPFDRFWVFAAGLTDVEVTLTVTDVLTGTSQTYQNPVGTPFQPILDTDAFATCDAAGFEPGASPNVEPPRVSTVLDELAEVLGTTLDAADTPCGTGEHLCLTAERFRIEATWRSDDGSGTASAVPLTADTGYFWFFGPDNVEVVVKVLDACGAPFERFWVFAAGLTDVEIDLTVTDQASGESKTYTNALGQPFQPVLDTDAFDTCTF